MWLGANNRSITTASITPPPTLSWKNLTVGAGGFVRGLVMHSDGTMIGRTDTAGAYLYNGTSWVQLVNATSLPQSYINTDPTVMGGGVYAVAIAPLNSSIFYMNFNNAMWVSNNKGTTWTQLASIGAGDPNSGGSAPGQRMAVDPNNSNIVYAGSDSGGLFVTSNGGTSWSVVSGIPVGSVNGILFNPAGGAVGGVTQVIYAGLSGTGVYKTTNGGTTWTLTTGGPTSIVYAAMAANGTYYAVGNAGAGIWTYNGTTWTEINSTPGSINFQAIAINPFNNNMVVAVSQAGPVNISYDAGATWTGSSTNMNLSTNDIPWLLRGLSFQGNPSPFFFLDAGGLAFSPITNGLLILSMGTGTMKAQIPASGATSSTAITWTDFSIGIENMVANEIIVPPGSGPVIAQWDRPFFFLTPGTYPSIYLPSMSDTVLVGWSIDYASSSPSFVCGITTNNGGHTTDGVTWTFFPTFPTGAPSFGGNIAASTPSNILWAPIGNVAPSFTTNGGTSWTQISIAGISTWTNFIRNSPLRRICADRVNATTFYLNFPGNGVYISTNGGSSWTKQFSGNIDTHANNDYQNSRILAVPTQAGNLFYTSGAINGNTSATVQPFYRSVDSGVTWTTVPNVNCVACFGFGAPAPGRSYPSIHISGFVGGVLGMWRSDDNCATWNQTGTYPGPHGLFTAVTMAADMNNFGPAYVGFAGFGHSGNGAGASYAYLAP